MTMKPTIAWTRDRTGHRGRLAALVLLAWLLAPSPAAAEGPGAYTARRFDVSARILAGGSLDVTETITFAFQSGTFRKVWREIPGSRTDGIDIASASMDGHPFTRGDGPGHITVSGSSRVRVEWQFAPAGPSTHTFELRYTARGVGYRSGGLDVVRWRLLPAEHRYKIVESRSTIAASLDSPGAPALESHRVDGVSTITSANGIVVVASGIGANGWVIAELHYPAGSLVTAMPGWQQRETSASALGPRWALAAGGIFVAAIVVLLMMRLGYAAPGFEPDQSAITEPPAALPVALAAALAAKGRASGLQAAVTLLDLADRGVLSVRELPRRLGLRNYEFSQVPGKHDLADHEAEAVTIAFAGSGEDVPMNKARMRLTRGAGRFARAVDTDLEERGLLDPSRKAVRDRLTVVSVGMLLVAGLGCIGVAALIPRYQAWPFLLPLALAVAGLVGVVMTATTTSLSDTGLEEGARWRAFKRHLKQLAGARGDDAGQSPVRSRWIVYGIALGLSYQWSRYLKKHPDAAPPWFVATGNDDAGVAFAAFVGNSGAGSAGTGSAGAGGAAAGGGSSGAG
jgi:hypothetical protein